MGGFFAEVQILAVLIGILNTVFLGYIAYQQYSTARAKLKLDLYDRRYRVYRGVLSLLGAVVRDGAVSNDELGKFYRRTHSGRFLFDADIRTYLTLVRQKAVQLRQSNCLVAAGDQVSEDRRGVAIEGQLDLLSWFDVQAEQVAHMFGKYLSFRKNL